MDAKEGPIGDFNIYKDVAAILAEAHILKYRRLINIKLKSSLFHSNVKYK